MEESLFFHHFIYGKLINSGTDVSGFMVVGSSKNFSYDEIGFIRRYTYAGQVGDWQDFQPSYNLTETLESGYRVFSHTFMSRIADRLRGYFPMQHCVILKGENLDKLQVTKLVTEITKTDINQQYISEVKLPQLRLDSELICSIGPSHIDWNNLHNYTSSLVRIIDRLFAYDSVVVMIDNPDPLTRLSIVDALYTLLPLESQLRLGFHTNVYGAISHIKSRLKFKQPGMIGDGHSWVRWESNLERPLVLSELKTDYAAQVYRLLLLFERGESGEVMNILQCGKGIGEITLSSRRLDARKGLAALDDPRFGEDRWYLLKDPTWGFKKISSGTFLMGRSLEHAQCPANDFDQPQHDLDLPTFYIGRYPATQEQFRAFLKDTGYEHQRSLEGKSNHPVVYVTWHDAMAYCEWLTHKLKSIAKQALSSNEIDDDVCIFWDRFVQNAVVATLPNEAEWEKSARGTDGHIYPWGNDFDSYRANMMENGLHGTSTVGCFPGGASPYGLVDMVGNVWEWTRNSLVPYPFDVSSNQEDNDKRVIRGCSFSSDEKMCRCSTRAEEYMHIARPDVGFRVAIVPK